MEIERILRETSERISRLYGNRLKNLILYGSWARKEATDNSDIDVAVVLEGPVQPCKEIDRLIEIITDINLKYGALLSIYPVSEKDYRTLNSPLIINLRKEGVLV